ncbi:MAG TPA: hypothetical protein VGO45_13430 [Bacteroidia bacterium]|jgi:hypothetical protein|nr:hypothetical protein [Bacteroidia bacterium]
MTDLNKINYLNIGLMLVSALVAFYLPFDLFLFVYAVLGPAHYLTEISWLHERRYFTKGKRDYIVLAILAVLLFFAAYVLKDLKLFQKDRLWYMLATTFIYIAFFSALVLVMLKDAFPRFVGIALVCVTAVIVKNPHVEVLFAIFIPTMIHVFVFTGLFILYGAMKSRSLSGYISFAVFLLCPILFILLDAPGLYVSTYARNTYHYFQALNTAMFDYFRPENNAGRDLNQIIFQSQTGVKIMRFIAFAYTYHYLNWFSKTTVIKWHLISKKRMALIAILWLFSVGLYRYDYKLGFDWLFLLSFLHVFLEFPLNHTSFIGIVSESKKLLGFHAQPLSVRKKSN